MANIVDLRPGRTPQRARRTAQLPLPSSKKPMPLRARRRRKRAIVYAGYAVALAILVYGVHYVSYLPALNVSKIEVSGNSGIPTDVIAQYADTLVHDGSYHFLSRANIFLYPKAVLERDIVLDIPGIETASVSRLSLFSNVLQIKVSERQPYAEWCGAGCFVMDESGFIYKISEASSTEHLAESYGFSGGVASSSEPIGRYFIPGHLPGLLALLAALQQQTGLTPGNIAVAEDTVATSTGQDFVVHFEEGFDLKASFGADAATLARNLKLVLNSDQLAGKASELEYVDLRFGNRVFYKLKGEGQAQQ